MGKITKTMQAKHSKTLSPWLRGFVHTAAITPLPLLPRYLNSFDTSWPSGRGDLYHWIALLNRFDDLLERFIKAYGLNQGPQNRELASDILLNSDLEASDLKTWTEAELMDLGYPPDGDRVLVESVLRFTGLLLEHCGNRSIYASSAHINDLLNTTSSSILIGALRVGSELAQRYQTSIKRTGNTSRQMNAALLLNHYNFDLDRVQQLALPFVKTPISSADSSTSAVHNAPRSAERVRGDGAKSACASHANDLVAIATSDDEHWKDWADVRILYFPQSPHHTPSSAPAERGHSPLPLSPTPSRRNPSGQSSQHTPKSRHAPVDDSSPKKQHRVSPMEEPNSTAQRSFEMPRSEIASTSIIELARRLPSDMTPAARHESFHRLRVAKAILGSVKSRQEVLAIRLLAITNLAYIHSESSFIDIVLRQDVDETRKYQLVYQLAELIHPFADGKVGIPIWLQSISLALLKAISTFHARSKDVLSALNANVNHGILLYVTRKAVLGMMDDDAIVDQGQADELNEWHKDLFSLTLHLAMSSRVGSEMVSAGLMEVLVDIVRLRSAIARRHHSMVLAFIDGLFWTLQNAFISFCNAGGLGVVADLMVDTVCECLKTLDSGVSPTQPICIVDYEIDFYQQQTVKWLTKFIHHVLTNSYNYGGNTDRLVRNLAENSELLRSLRVIIEKQKSFGSLAWTSSVLILSDFINNDPTSYAAISESGMIKSYLEAVTGRPISEQDERHRKESEHDDEDSGESSRENHLVQIPDRDDRPHPPTEDMLRQEQRVSLADGILPASDAMNVIPQVLNSISLNYAGLKLVLDCHVFDSFFEIFESQAHVKCMETNTDLAQNIGSSFDELARHHPPMRTTISLAVVDMVARVRFLGLQKARVSGWGAKLFLGTQDQLLSVTEEGTIENASCTAAQTREHAATGDPDDVDMTDAAPLPAAAQDNLDGGAITTTTESFVPFVHAMASFLSAFFSNTILKTNFVNEGGIELLLDICESPSLPAIFCESSASRTLIQVVTQLVDQSPIRGLPSLLQRAQKLIAMLQPLAAKKDPFPPYFAPFLSDRLIDDINQITHKDEVLKGTKIVKSLLNAQTLIKILADSFPSARGNALSFHPVNVYDHYLNLVKAIGPLLRGVLAEEAGQLSAIPQHWSTRRYLPSSGGDRQAADTSAEEAHLSDVLIGTDGWRPRASANSSGAARPSPQEQASPRFQNYETLRILLHPIIPTAFPLFQSLGKSLLPRRSELSHLEQYARCRHLEIARALARTVLDHLEPSVQLSDPTSKDFHYWIIILHTIHELLIDNPSTRHNDRPAAHIIMPVLLAFKEEGGLVVFSSMLEAFAHTVRQGGDDPSDGSSNVKVAAFGLKKLLDLYHILINAKLLSDTATSFSLRGPALDRTHSAALYQQIVLELRHALMPTVMTLWDAKFIEKVPDPTVKRLLDILKLVSTNEHELQSVPKNALPFDLFKQKDARFDWQCEPIRSTTDETLRSHSDHHLVYEAIYRANGSSNLTSEYFEVHTAGSAGPRNPIPEEDADISAPSDSVPQESSASFEQGAEGDEVSAETDQMALDTPPTSTAEGLAVPAERQSLVDSPSSQTPAPPSSNEDHRIEMAPILLAKEGMDQLRASLRDNLIDHCLDVVRAHPETAIDVSDLISTVLLRRQNGEAQEEIGATITFALSSLAFDDEEKKRNGQCIAAYAHLLALLLQDDKFFDRNAETLKGRVHEYIAFLKIPLSASVDDLPPWIPYILLIIESLLCHDERVVAATWKPPKSIEEAVTAPVAQENPRLLSDDQRIHVLESLLDLLPRTGKEETLDTSILRVLVILTRSRQSATLVGEKKNLQRLFLMAKQLSGSGSERLKQTKLTSYIVAVLRHVVEDEEISKQIMRTEIQNSLTTLTRPQRGVPDVASYLKALAPVALRAPKMFVILTNELVEIKRWQPPASEGGRAMQLVLKEADTDKSQDANAAEYKDDLDKEVKQSTEGAAQETTEGPKVAYDLKRPVVENPDGVIHFLLCELVNYREVDDKESSVSSKEPSSGPALAVNEEDKQTKNQFKTEEHPIFVYRCFLLNCLAELLQSYNQTKIEFINFKRSAPPVSTHTPIKPRSSILNYLIYDLLCQDNLDGNCDSVAAKKKAAISSLAQKVLVALVAKTGERRSGPGKPTFPYDVEPDLLFVRKFVLDTVLKAYEKAPNSDDSLEIRYSRMQYLAELMNQMIGEKDKDQAGSTRGNESLLTSQKQLRHLMYEKGYIDKLTTSIAEINLNYPGVKKPIKHILRVLRVLTSTAKELSLTSALYSEPTVGDVEEEEFSSNSSLSELDDDREETPDLYRNSALGMLEPRAEDDESEDNEEDDDEDMYEDEYNDEDMEYGDEDMSDGEENISDEDEELTGMGEIEGLHGDPGVVEVIMDDEEEEETSDDDDGADSADAEDIEDRVEVVEEENPIDEDGASEWESESDDEDDEELEADDAHFGAEDPDVQEGEMHSVGAGELLDNMARTIMGEMDSYEPEHEQFLDEIHDEEENDEDEEDEDEIEEEYVYDEDYPDEQVPSFPSLGWDSLTPDISNRHRQLFFLDGHRRRPVLTRMDNLSPGPATGSNRDHLGRTGQSPILRLMLTPGADFRSYFSRTHRSAAPQSNVEDGMNPLLRRNNNVSENLPRDSLSRSVGLRLPEGMFGNTRNSMDGPMGLLGELMEFLPMIGRNVAGQSYHFHLTSPRGGREAREISHLRSSRNDARRDTSAQEPHQAVSFACESTLDRYQEEARIIFGANFFLEASKLSNMILGNLTPAAIVREKKIKAEEAEMQQKVEANRKQEEEERKAQQKKMAEEQAEKERKEREEQEASEPTAPEAPAVASQEEGAISDTLQVTSEAMEGVEANTSAYSGESIEATVGSTNDCGRRVTTTLRGEEVDVTELGIDPEYLAALPEEFREEVIAQTVSERRSQAREEAATGETTEVFQEFLDALPAELRQEIAQQERQDERRRQREGRRHASQGGSQSAVAAEMDPASILLTFPPELRAQALIDQGEDLMDQLPPDMAAQARALVEQHAPIVNNQTLRSLLGSGRVLASPETGGTDQLAADGETENKAQRRAVAQIMDKSGIATLLRLMFIAQRGSIRNYLFSVFADVCENRHNRLEVISSVLQILQEGSIDMNAVERSFGQLSLKARKSKEKDPELKTPQILKRVPPNVGVSSATSTNSETSPLLIVQQCLDLLVDLCTSSHSVPWLFLTEHEIVGTTLKRALSRKGKTKDSKAHKYAINSLLTLLDRELVTESSLVMTHLADLLNRVTLPLLNLERRRKETRTGEEALTEPSASRPNATEEPSSDGNAQSVAQTQEGAAAGSGSADEPAATESKPEQGRKRARQLPVPVIPPQNLTLVVRIFTARECNSKTFQNTISTIKNLSTIPGAKEAFGEELVRQARLLSENIVSDLDELLPHIGQASTGTEIQGIALAKFSPGASEQNKLLRVLTALDHLFDGKKKPRNDDGEAILEKEKRHLVTSLYHNSTFSKMWEKLSACLHAIRQREGMLNVATILLPLIESLMVVCKNTSLEDQPPGNASKEMVLSSPPPESRTANLFYSFTEEHRRILNELVRHNPKLMSGTFSLLVQNPKVLDFDNKRNYFSRSVHARTGQNSERPSYPSLQLSVRREHVFHDSFKSLYFKSGDEMKFGKLNIRFHGEEGVDAGGVTREWFQVLARQMFNPNYALFIPVSSDRTTFHPNKLSGINDEHLMFFKFIGRIIGKALYEGRLLDCFFSRAVYKRILGKSVSVKDMESLDPDYYKSLCWMLENDITDVITETFSVEDDEFGIINIVDLIPNGREVAVIEDNKHEYVRLVVEHKLLSSVKTQMENFLKGFHDIAPARLISIFNEQELELLISGLPDIDVDDWKSNTEYQNYTPSSQQIQWFWRAVRSFDKEERAKLLQFVTGTSKVPLNGFKELEGMNGVNRFNIHRDYGNKDRLPSSHTCFNQLDLPEYESYDMLYSQVLKAITQGSEYFGFA